MTATGNSNAGLKKVDHDGKLWGENQTKNYYLYSKYGKYLDVVSNHHTNRKNNSNNSQFTKYTTGVLRSIDDCRRMSNLPKNYDLKCLCIPGVSAKIIVGHRGNLKLPLLKNHFYKLQKYANQRGTDFRL